MKNMDYEVNRLSALTYGTIIGLRKFKNQIEEQFEQIPPEYYEGLERTNPHRVAIDDARIPFDQISEILDEVDKLNLYPDKKNISWTEASVDEEYLVLKSRVIDGINEDINEAEIYKFDDKLKAIQFCMDESKKEVERCYKASHDYSSRIDGDSFFVYESDTSTETIFTIREADKVMN
ncbi:hypothetical protein [Carnobacterium sp. FSL E2-0243]|uniref:hypothetical protein n=1 Tax=Carnobacterium sp. FSL E2-0243 TaxID=2921365 RepID=UPI0030FCA385